MISYGKRLKYAVRAFFSILDYSRIPDDIVAALVTKETVPAPVAVPPPSDGPARALQILSLLQRDGRLVDFLMEDIRAYGDAQVGAAVRDVHAGCAQSLQRYCTLRPVLEEDEGGPVTVEHGIDPARIKIVGNTSGALPLHGIVRHRGWEAMKVELPPLPGTGRMVIAPAEIEVA